MAYLGMRGNGDWSDSDMRPKNWREGILFLWPNGMAPLTAILSKLASKKADDPEFFWWTKGLPNQRATVNGVYTDVGLSSPYVSGGTDGTTLYFKMAAADATHFRAGHEVLLRDASDYAVDVVAKCTAKVTNAANSYIAAKLLEDDDNSATHDLSDCDTALIIGNLNPEGGTVPDAIAYDPTKYNNYTQIWKTPLSITRTARLTRLRTADAYKEARREALQLHSIEMEKSLIWGIPTEKTGDNGKPERTTGGLLYFIKTYAADNVDDYTQNTDYTGQTWLQKGKTWFNIMLEQLFRYGRPEKLAFCGSGAILGIQELAEAFGSINLVPGAAKYGVKVLTWVTPFGDLHLKTHPLLSFEATNRNSMIVFEPQELVERPLTQTRYEKDPGENEGGSQSVDGIVEQYLTESGLELHHPTVAGYLNGVGLDA